MGQVRLKLSYGLIEFVDAGSIAPWIGSSLRGMMLRPLKDSWCVLEEAEKRERQERMLLDRNARYCLGCHKNQNCDYGRVFESDRSLIDKKVLGGRGNGLVAITIGGRKLFQVQQANNSSPRISQVRILAAGDLAIGRLDEVMDQLSSLGSTEGICASQSCRGIRFSMRPESIQFEEHCLRTESLPTSLDSTKSCSIKIKLETPLVIKSELETGKRNYLTSFDFSTFLSYSVRTVRRAINELANSDWNCNLSSFFEHVASVVVSKQTMETVDLRRSSHRQDGNRWDLIGLLGELELDNVPVDYLPWLHWAGILGIGDSRNCGTGCFSVARKTL